MILSINQLDIINAFNEDLWEAFSAAIDNLNEKKLRAVVITGEELFCAGFDVNPDNLQVASLRISAASGH